MELMEEEKWLIDPKSYTPDFHRSFNKEMESLLKIIHEINRDELFY